MQVGGTAQELHHNALRWEPAAHVQRLSTLFLCSRQRGRAARRAFEPFAPGGFWYCTVMSRDFSHSPTGRQVREARPPRRPRLGDRKRRQPRPDGSPKVYRPPATVVIGVPVLGRGRPLTRRPRAGETYPPRFASPRGVRHDQGGLRRNIDEGDYVANMRLAMATGWLERHTNQGRLIARVLE
jgi:hypothetical protein